MALHPSRAFVVGVAVLVVSGIAVCLYFFGYRGSSARHESAQPTQGVEQMLLQTAVPFAPYDEQEVPDLVRQFRAACEKSCRDLSGAARMEEGLLGTFCDEAAERLRLYLAPSWDAYRVYAIRLTGRDPAGSKVTNISPNRDSFDAGAVRMSLLPIDPSTVHVRQVYDRGKDVSPLTSRCSYSPDSGKFFSRVGQTPEQAGATIYEVLVPVEYPDALSDVSVRVVLGMAFVLEDGVWKPWRMGVHDPSGADHVFSPPWL